MHTTLSSVKRNLLKIFPLVNEDFRIHIIIDGNEEVISNFDETIMSELSTIITLGNDFSDLCDLVPVDFPDRKSDLIEARETERIPVSMTDNTGNEHEYTIEINGWIGTYKTTRGRKLQMTDFPDNFISLYANKKLGEFNILPIVGQNKLSEVYVVGQLHVDIFELSELPDMALSNRQGYKSDDKRYELVCKYIRSKLLEDILKKRKTYTELKNNEKNIKRYNEQLQDENNLRERVDKFRDDTVNDITDAVSDKKVSQEKIKEIVSSSLNKNISLIGLKRKIDNQKRKILISQTLKDKAFADIIYQMLLFNGVSAEEILYTNCDHEESRIPEEKKVYEYLRDFFVESYSTEKIYVIFVTSEHTKASWGAITEVGAAWITQINNKIFNIFPFKPEHPLDDEKQWQTTNRENDQLWVSKLDADVFCVKIESICKELGYYKKTRQQNMDYLSTLITVK